MSGKLNGRTRSAPTPTGEVRVVVERREIDDPAGELSLAELLVQMLDRRRHSRGDSKR